MNPASKDEKRQRYVVFMGASLMREETRKSREDLSLGLGFVGTLCSIPLESQKILCEFTEFSGLRCFDVLILIFEVSRGSEILLVPRFRVSPPGSLPASNCDGGGLFGGCSLQGLEV